MSQNNLPFLNPKQEKTANASSGVMRVFWGSYAGRLKVPMPMLHMCAHLREGPLGPYIKEGRGSGSDLATHNHDVLTVVAALPLGNAFPPRGRHAPPSADSLHFAAQQVFFVKVRPLHDFLKKNSRCSGKDPTQATACPVCSRWGATHVPPTAEVETGSEDPPPPGLRQIAMPFGHTEPSSLVAT